MSPLNTCFYKKKNFGVAILGLFFLFCLSCTKKEDIKNSNPAALAFVTVWKTTSPNEAIMLPLVDSGTYDFTVEWGDGTTNVIKKYDDPAKKHAYKDAGEHTVTIKGTIEDFSFVPNRSLSNVPAYAKEYKDYAPKLYNILSWGPLKLKASYGSFSGSSLTKVTPSDVPDLSGIDNLSGMFWVADQLVSVDFMDKWDTSKVTDMSQMFQGATAFNQDLSKWDTSMVTDMFSMFQDATVFNQDLSKWDTSMVTTMKDMFYGATAFNQDLSKWDTSKVTDMDSMFKGATAFNQDLSKWDTSKVTTMEWMFYEATAFNQDISGWKVSNVKDHVDFDKDANANWSAAKKPKFPN